MPAIRLFPINDDAEFPYAEIKRWLERDAELTPKDFGPMIEAGRKMRWTEAMIRANEELAIRGKCFDFEMRIEPYSNGTLFEDNVFLNVDDDRATLEYFQQIAKRFGVELYIH